MTTPQPFTRREQINALRTLIRGENENIDFYRDEDIPAVERELDSLAALADEPEAQLAPAYTVRFSASEIALLATALNQAVAQAGQPPEDDELLLDDLDPGDLDDGPNYEDNLKALHRRILSLTPD